MKKVKQIIALRIDEPLLEKVRGKAEEQGLDQSKYIRKAIEEKVELDDYLDIQ